MIVRKTLFQIYKELEELREIRNLEARLVAKRVAEGRDISMSLEEYKHYDELLKYLSQIEVEYEDKYATEEEDD